MIETLNVTDHFLIAMPGMGDPNFHRTVTYMCQHSSEGALGIVINRPTELTLGDILQQMSIEIDNEKISKTPIYFGGPVQPERGFVIHRPKGSWDSSLKVSDSVALTTSRDILEAIAHGRGPDRFMVALGYAGWGQGQLEREMVQNAWLNSPAADQILFELPADQRWRSAARQMGIDIDRLSSSAGHG